MKCYTYGVLCNYGYDVRDLQPLSEKQAKQQVVKGRRLLPPRPNISNNIWAEDELVSLNLDLEDQELFKRFRGRTLLTLGGPETIDIYENHLLPATFTVSLTK